MAIYGECPYYRYEKAGITHCECADLHFPDAEARREVLYNYCANAENYRKCPLHTAMEHYYERSL